MWWKNELLRYLDCDEGELESKHVDLRIKELLGGFLNNRLMIETFSLLIVFAFSRVDRWSKLPSMRISSRYIGVACLLTFAWVYVSRWFIGSSTSP
jgi:hypothetical protein